MLAKQTIGKSFTGALNYNLKKLNHPDPKERAELLSTNFTSMDPATIKKELTMMKAMNSKLKRNTYHTSLNFAVGEKISNQKMQQITEEYLNKMGFDSNLHIIFRHHDSNHPHCHILALRNRFDGTVVSDSRNYQRSEQVIRELEIKYNLQKVASSRQSKNKAPNKDELEMIQRTGKASHKLLLQEKVRYALNHSITMRQFISNLEKQNISVLFNQASTGRVSGITYMIPGFKIRGQALGNQYKFGSIIKQINYEQSRDGQAIHQANSRTREKFGTRKKKEYAGNQSFHHRHDGIDSDGHSKSSQDLKSSKRAFTTDPGDPRTDGSTGRISENHEVEVDGFHDRSVLAGLAGLLDGVIGSEREEKKKDEKRKRGMSR